LPGGPGWDDERISEGLEVGRATVERVRKEFVEEGLEAALRRLVVDDGLAIDPQRLSGPPLTTRT
jgi:hypothetical protein